MCERVNNVLDRSICELAGDGRIDPEDAHQICKSAAATRHMAEPRGRLVDLMRNNASKIDPEALGMLKAGLDDEIPDLQNRVLLRSGDRGPNVRKLRAALGAAADVLGDKRFDPGPGDRFDTRCQVALRGLQDRMHKPPTGELDSRTLLVINYVLKESEAPLLDVDLKKHQTLGIRLEFFPGDAQRKLVVRQYGSVVDVYDMRGGPAKRSPDDRPFVDERFSWAPTPRGRYTIGANRVHTTRAWKYSQIPFGADLREHDGQVQFRTSENAHWKFATGPDSVFAGRGPHKEFSRSDFLVDGELPARWEKNDFGHRAVFLKRGDRTMGHIIHPTYPGEARYGDDSYKLLVSHGCEHMRPHDLDEALSKGYLRKGTPFVVRGYDSDLPKDVKEFLLAKP